MIFGKFVGAQNKIYSLKQPTNICFVDCKLQINLIKYALLCGHNVTIMKQSCSNGSAIWIGYFD